MTESPNIATKFQMPKTGWWLIAVAALLLGLLILVWVQNIKLRRKNLQTSRDFKYFFEKVKEIAESAETTAEEKKTGKQAVAEQGFEYKMPVFAASLSFMFQPLNPPYNGAVAWNVLSSKKNIAKKHTIKAIFDAHGELYAQGKGQSPQSWEIELYDDNGQLVKQINIPVTSAEIPDGKSLAKEFLALLDSVSAENSEDNG